MESKYNPSILRKILILLFEQAFCTYLVLTKLFPFIADLILLRLGFGNTLLPTSVSALLNKQLMAKLINNNNVTDVQYSDRLEQHANSTDRAWFTITLAPNNTKIKVFAKTQAKTLMVRMMLCMFDVYRNEVDAYKNLNLPVRHPHVLGAEHSPSRFVLVMEDLRENNVVFPNIWERKVGPALAKQVLTTLAQLHAKYWGAAVPDSCWKGDKKPYKSILVGFVTLYRVRNRLPKLLNEDVMRGFSRGLWQWPLLEEFWSRSYPRTMCHGDTHIGNFYIQPSKNSEKDKEYWPEGQVGTFDLQCKAEEHPMRDLTYFLSCSMDSAELEKHEKELFQHYRDKLVEFGVDKNQVPSMENMWLQYRLQVFYAMYAFIFSGGFSDLMDNHQTQVGVERIAALFSRIKAEEALCDLIDGKI